MKIEILVANVLGVIIEVLLFNRVFHLISDGVEFKKIWINLYNIVLIIVISLSNYFVDIPIERSMIMYILLFSISIAYKCSGSKKIIYTIILVIAMLLCEMLFGMLMSLLTRISIEETQQNVFYYFLGAVVSKLILFIIALFVKNNRVISVKINVIPFIVLPMATVIVIYTLGELYYSLTANNLETIAFAGIIALCFSNILFFYLFEKQMQEQIKINEQIILNNELISQTRHMKELLEKYKISNKVLHDLDNKIIAVKGLLRSDNAEANKSVIELTNFLEKTKQTPLTGLNGVDALLNNKIELIESKNIELKQRYYLEKELKIQEIDLCVLLGNLIDNAIEAVSFVEKNRYIAIEISSKMEKLYIVIDNSTIQNEVSEKTSKQDKYKHGYENNIINEIVDKYDGIVNRMCENNVYQVIVMI